MTDLAIGRIHARTRRARAAAHAARFAAWAVLAFTVVVACAPFVPQVAGYRSMTVMSGSMMPTIAVGDIVVGRPVAPGSVSVGDVVTFRDPEGTGKTLTHRVVAIRSSGNSVAVTTKGDANSSVERWTVARSGRILLVVYRIPKAGYAFVAMRSPVGRMLLVALPVVALGVLQLVRIWKQPDDVDEAS